MRRLEALCLALALTFGLVGCQSRTTTDLDPSLSPAPDPAPVLAFFGGSDEPWDETLRDAVDQWCDEKGWELVAYDCLGQTGSRTVQIRDLARSGGAEMAVLCAAGEDALAEGAADLAGGGAKVVTFSRLPAPGPETAAAHLSPSAQDILAAAGAFFEEPPEGAGIVILHDVETAPLEAAARTGLEEAGAVVLEETYTWGSVDFARQFLSDALTRHSGAVGALTFSSTGAQGARVALDEMDRFNGRILCLDWSEALQADLDQGRLDGLLALQEEGLVRAFRQTLDDVAAGKTPGEVPLAVEVRRAAQD